MGAITDMMKKILLLSFLFYFLFLPTPLFAQVSVEKRTKVGNPVVSDLQDIIACAETITQELQKASLYSIKPSEPGVYYWCTYLIVDCYTKHGAKGLSRGAHGSVFAMRRFFASTPGYIYVDYLADKQKALNQIEPGYAIFLQSVFDQHTNSEHVSIIKTKQIDAHGNGYIETLDSNSSSRGHKFPVAGWQVKNTFYPVVGFGGV